MRRGQSIMTQKEKQSYLWKGVTKTESQTRIIKAEEFPWIEDKEN